MAEEQNEKSQEETTDAAQQPVVEQAPTTDPVPAPAPQASEPTPQAPTAEPVEAPAPHAPVVEPVPAPVPVPQPAPAPAPAPAEAQPQSAPQQAPVADQQQAAPQPEPQSAAAPQPQPQPAPQQQGYQQQPQPNPMPQQPGAQPNQAPYQQQPQPGAPAPSMAPTLILGIIAILGALFIPLVGVISGIAAIVLARKDQQIYGPASKAKPGKILGIIGLVLSCLVWVANFVLLIGMY